MTILNIILLTAWLTGIPGALILLFEPPKPPKLWQKLGLAGSAIVWPLALWFALIGAAGAAAWAKIRKR